MKIKIKRSDTDSKVEDFRPYVKRLIILVNKLRLPMLFYALDYNKMPKANFWHVIYKLNSDTLCPFVALRIMSRKAEFGKSSFLIQVLDFVHGGAAHERLIHLSKIKVLSETEIIVPATAKSRLL